MKTTKGSLPSISEETIEENESWLLSLREMDKWD
jgi:hypothetical protein